MAETKPAPEGTNVPADVSEPSEPSRRDMIGKVFSAMGAVAVGSLLAAPGDAQAQFGGSAPAQAASNFRLEKLDTGGFALKLTGGALATALQREGLKSKLGAGSSVTLTWS